jgi:hypothetical protein
LNVLAHGSQDDIATLATGDSPPLVFWLLHLAPSPRLPSPGADESDVTGGLVGSTPAFDAGSL